MSEPAIEPVEPAVEPASEPVEPAAVEPAAEPAVPQGPNWEDPALLNEAAARIAALGYNISPVAAPAAEPAAEPELDTFDPDSVRAFVERQLQAEREQILAQVAPVQQFVQAQTKQQEEAGLASTIAAVRDELGYKAPGEDPAALDAQIRGMAEFLFQQASAGIPEPRTPLEAIQVQAYVRSQAEKSVRDAVQFFADHDKALKDAGREEYLASLRAGGSTPYEPGVRAVGLQTERPAAKSEQDAAAQFLERRRATQV